VASPPAASSSGSISLSAASDIFLRLLALKAAFAFFEFFFGFGAGSGGGGGSVRRYNRLSSRMKYVRSSESHPNGSMRCIRYVSEIQSWHEQDTTYPDRLLDVLLFFHSLSNTVRISHSPLRKLL
jgi:hypothetical protein